MPTAKPRVQVSLSTPQFETLQRLAKLQSRSMSAVIAELFEQVHPVLERVAVVLQAAVRAQDSMRQGLRQSTEDAERELRPLVNQAMGQLDLLQADFERAVMQPSAGAGATAKPGAANPRPVTRGSGLKGTHRREHSQKRRKALKSTKRGTGR